MIATLHSERNFQAVYFVSIGTQSDRRTWSINCQFSERLARLLLLLANFGKEARRSDRGKISQKCAEMIGTTRARESFP
jgi:hypothetical protein